MDKMGNSILGIIFTFGDYFTESFGMFSHI